MSKPKEEPKRDVIKSSAAIHIHNNITLLQRRVWNVLLFNAYNELEKKEEHQIALKDLSTLVGYDSHDMDYLKEEAEAMVRCTVQWDILDKDGSPEVTVQVVKTGITPQLATSARLREAETERLHPVGRLHTRW